MTRRGATPAGSWHREYSNVPGNYYDKYNAANPVARYLMRGFFKSFDRLADRTSVGSAYEVGCGEGHLSLRLFDRGWDVRGSDLESGPIEQANARAVARGAGPVFDVADLYELDPDVVANDLVICCEVLEHLPDPHRALAILTRMARPYLLLSVPDEPLWRILNVCRARYLRNFGNTPGHIQHWSTRAFLDLLSRYTQIVAHEKPLPWTMVLCRCE